MSRRIVTSIRGAIGPAEIERLPIHGRRELRVYYPYHWLVFRAPGRSCHCLVDARTGLVATADPFPTETCEVPEDDVLDATVGGG